ncbi:hypothetical protein F2P81_010703 [Scophthalmus maximus]|uniref:Uncharacterized protein n=1 Tax=Scophthalmus maximus TaxID=52904 RepID=A0A6A4SYN7_SCOMX|nr:hypothetical protein F2P81_010703 [Scophthalmus maximus]
MTKMTSLATLKCHKFCLSSTSGACQYSWAARATFMGQSKNSKLWSKSPHYTFTTMTNKMAFLFSLFLLNPERLPLQPQHISKRQTLSSQCVEVCRSDRIRWTQDQLISVVQGDQTGRNLLEVLECTSHGPIPLNTSPHELRFYSTHYLANASRSLRVFPSWLIADGSFLSTIQHRCRIAAVSTASLFAAV